MTVRRLLFFAAASPCLLATAEILCFYALMPPAKVQPMIRASSARSWKLCKRRAWYEYYPPEGFQPAEDRFDTLIAEAGQAHELAVKASLEPCAHATSARHTQELISQKTAVIYQPVLIDKGLGVEGRPDFLIRAHDGNYQVADAKLAAILDDKKEIYIQLSVYRKLLSSPLPAIVFMGSGDRESVGDEHLPLAGAFLENMRELLDRSEPPQAFFSESKCKLCPFDAVCRSSFEESGELTLVYGIDSRSAPGLLKQGIKTIEDLAQRDPQTIVDVPYLKGFDKKRRAVLQARSYLSGQVIQLAPAKLPDATLIHFDVESNPLSPLQPVYLWGWLPPPYTREAFQYTWSDGSEDQDKAAWLGFLRGMEECRASLSNVRLAHFSHFEVTQIERYAERYAMREDPTVSWLLDEPSPMFDIQKPVTEAFVLPLLGYGLKYICKDKRVVNFQWEVKESGSQWSVVRYLDYLSAGPGKERDVIKTEILSYNRDDVRATRALEVWLRERGSGETPIRRAR